MVMASSQDNFGILDQCIPLWKRELILRRRATTSRTLAANSSSSASGLGSPEVSALPAAGEKPLAATKDQLDQDEADFHPGVCGRQQHASTAPVAGNMRLVEVADGDVVNGVRGGVDSKSNGSIMTCSVKYRSRMVEERSSKKSSAASRTIMDNSLVRLAKVRQGKNNNCDHADNEECNSDSSEELQYGPGIVNKLKSKYLSLALRETQNRPSLSNIRRYSSLENILDNDLGSGKPQITNQLATYTKKADASTKAESRFRPASRGSRKESMKRACSVETLHRYNSRVDHAPSEGVSLTAGFPSYSKPSPLDVNKNRPASMINPLVNDEVVIIENKMKMEPKKCEGKFHTKERAPSVPQKSRTPRAAPPEKELPPADAVKQRLKIFESSRTPARSVKTVVDVKIQPAINMNSMPNTNIPKTNVLQNVFSKPALSPKLNIAKEKTRVPVSPSLASPRVPVAEEVHSGSSSPTFTTRPDMLHVEPASLLVSPNRSPATYRKLESPSPVPIVQSPCPDTSPEHSPAATPTSLQSRLTNGDASIVRTHAISSEDSSSGDDDNSEAVYKISKSALENIRKDGASMSFSFSGASGKPQSHLPSPRTAAGKPRAPSPVLVSKPAEPAPGRRVGVIRPILASKPRSPPPPTRREAEKNLVNRVKSVEHPTRSVVAPVPKPRGESVVVGETVHASGASSEVSSAAKAPGLWDKKKPWNLQQNTMVFNFSGTKSPVPDYIENDGVILRSKRQKPKPGESGIILLGASADESSDWDTEEDRLGPPSPCDVVFEGANVLINGKSSMAHQPRQHKLRITFSEILTSTFEYPSESSLLEDQMATPSTSISPGAVGGSAPGLPSLLGGSSLASYTPSKVLLGSEDFQLGITRAVPPPQPQPVMAPLDVYELDQGQTYLTPAQDGDTVAWSAETAADLLF